MINVSEHVYHDDPKVGHPDVKTRLKDVDYFFIGNGLIQGAVQCTSDNEASPYGLLIMNPERLGAKRDALSLDQKTGLADTIIRIKALGTGEVLMPTGIEVRWLTDAKVPTVEIRWRTGIIEGREAIYCPDLDSPVVCRDVTVRSEAEQLVEFEIITGLTGTALSKKIALSSQEEKTVYLHYTLDPSENQLAFEFAPFELNPKAAKYWKRTAQVDFHHPLINHYFSASAQQLAMTMSQTGKVDASIWQYCREWVRDHSFMVAGLTLSGHHRLAGIVLDRLLREFVSEEGDCVDSSERRDADEVELDQNGMLLSVLQQYILWTGDNALIDQHWPKIQALAEFPLRETFRHQPSGLHYNQRELWERHAAHGIEPGIELMYQFWPSVGLQCASSLAKLQHQFDLADRWEAEAARLKEAVLYHPQFSMIDERGFIKRRGLDGNVQESITPRADSGLPEGVPLAGDFIHFLRPDTSATWPIIMGFVAPQSEIARRTMDDLETLWNQSWDIGGYSRYNVTSEPDSDGPWPFGSLMMARASLEMGDYNKVWRTLDWLDSIPGANAGSWFEMYGRRIAPPFAQVGIPPWTWGEMVMLLVHHVLGIQPGEKYLRFRPRLLPGIKKVTGSLPLRGKRIHLDLETDPGVITPAFTTNIFSEEMEEGELHIFYDDQDVNIKGRFPEISG